MGLRAKIDCFCISTDSFPPYNSTIFLISTRLQTNDVSSSSPSQDSFDETSLDDSNSVERTSRSGDYGAPNCIDDDGQSNILNTGEPLNCTNDDETSNHSNGDDAVKYTSSSTLAGKGLSMKDFTSVSGLGYGHMFVHYDNVQEVANVIENAQQ
ncbi:unnamed protein product [Adineta steineri]|uniref:Uncharacterized protein n=1 Tax=Adineta steineri TaxID=433720 RepID=A0A815JPU4_9BILA|nr:unnamed protein product [Adineta steineri]CAF1608911.1 unnamed protein product [Adineta steineri]